MSEMTPTERAALILGEHTLRVEITDDDAARLVEAIDDAIRAAVLAEREACAQVAEAGWCRVCHRPFADHLNSAMAHNFDEDIAAGIRARA